MTTFEMEATIESMHREIKYLRRDNSQMIGPWKKEAPTEEGLYLNRYWRQLYPRLIFVWRGPKSGKFYACRYPFEKRSRTSLDHYSHSEWLEIPTNVL